MIIVNSSTRFAPDGIFHFTMKVSLQITIILHNKKAPRLYDITSTPISKELLGSFKRDPHEQKECASHKEWRPFPSPLCIPQNIMHSLSFEFQQWNSEGILEKDESVVRGSVVTRCADYFRRAEKGFILSIMRNVHGNKDLTEIFSVKSISSEGRFKVNAIHHLRPVFFKKKKNVIVHIKVSGDI